MSGTSTPQITSTSTTAIQTDSIIGVWRVVDGPNDYRIQFNSDETVLSTNNGGADISDGKWVLKGTLDSGDTAYSVTINPTIETYVYSNTKNTLYSTSYPRLVYTSYKGNLGLTTPVPQTPTKTPAETTPQIQTQTPIRTATTISTTGGDQAAINKMIEMNDWMAPTMQVIGDSASSGDYLKMGLNALLLEKYINKNLPEMRQLANGASSKKAAALEYVSALEDIRTSADLAVQATDKYNSGDIDGATQLLLEGNSYTTKASAHLRTSNALL